MADEVEVNFDVATDDVAALKGCPALAGAAPSLTEVDTACFDTKNGLVRRSGYSLRVRRAGGRHIQAVKQRSAGSAGLYVRREWEAAVPVDPLFASPAKGYPVGLCSEDRRRPVRISPSHPG